MSHHSHRAAGTLLTWEISHCEMKKIILTHVHNGLFLTLGDEYNLVVGQ